MNSLTELTGIMLIVFTDLFVDGSVLSCKVTESRAAMLSRVAIMTDFIAPSTTKTTLPFTTVELPKETTTRANVDTDTGGTSGILYRNKIYSGTWITKSPDYLIDWISQA